MLTVKDICDKRYTRDDFMFFWGHTGTGKACLSQWYPSPFVIDGVCCNCAEQYMMSQKARIFGDMKAYDEIMSSCNPMEMKKLGRRVSNFDPHIWDVNCIDVVKKANISKFSQNPRLREFLLSTADIILVEASPYDTIWGIGLPADSPDAVIPARWRGENRLGFVLMAVRDLLRRNEDEKSGCR